MRKNKALIVVAIVLIAVMMSVMFVGCSQKEDSTTQIGPKPGESTDAAVYTLNQANSDIYFILKSDLSLAAVKELVAVKTSSGTAVDVTIEKYADGYIVYAPYKGYEKGRIYSITLGNGVSFADYANYSKIMFTIGSETVSNIRLQSDVVQYSSSAVDGLMKVREADAYGNALYTMSLNTRGVVLEKGTIIYIYGEDEMSSAYKVEQCTKLASKESWVSLSCTTPDAEEVFAEFEYINNEAMKEDDITFVVEETIAELNGSELAQSIVTLFGSTPTFSIDEFSYSDGAVYITIKVTIPDVVKTEIGTSNLYLTIENKLTANAVSNINIKNLADLLTNKSFNLYADVKNEVTCKVGLEANASYTGIKNLQDILDKLIALASDDEDSAVSVPLFTWTLPIANGVASISYNAELVFRFAFSGDINLTATADIVYECGVVYTEDDGLQVYQNIDKDKTKLTSVNFNMKGVATMQVGIAQTISLDILAGVLGVGIKAEIGNYNNLYGAVITNNLVDSNVWAAGIYFDGGFYYDVDLTYGVKIGSLLNLTGAVDIANGEIELYNLGKRYLDLGISEVANTTEYDIVASTTPMPTYYTKIYDLKTMSTYNEAIDASNLQFISTASYFTITDGILTLNESGIPGTGFDVNVAVKYLDDITYTKVSYNASKPLLNYNYFNVDKQAASDIVINVTYGADADISVEGINSDIKGKTITLKERKILQLPEGENVITIKVGIYSLDVVINVTGKVGYNAYEKDGAYELFAADQILEMIELSNSGVDFAGMTFTVIEDIDMKGMSISPIASFAGNLQGNKTGGKAVISNYTVTSMAGNNSGLIAVNNGTIENINFAGNVDVSFGVKTGKTYNVGGLVGVNNGSIIDCMYTGSVKATNTSLAAFTKLYVGGLTATNEGTINEGSSVENSTITAVTTYDIANNKIYVNAKGTNVIGSIECTYGFGIITKGEIAK